MAILADATLSFLKKNWKLFLFPGLRWTILSQLFFGNMFNSFAPIFSQQLYMSLIIHNQETGNYFSANTMIMFMVAHELANRVNGAILSNYIMPDWGIDYCAVPQSNELCVNISNDQRLDVTRIQYLLKTNLIERVNLRGWFQRMEYFPTLETCRGLFPSRSPAKKVYGSNFVVCPVRGAEILKGIHPDYVVVPIAFYQKMFDQIGKQPVFIGQIEENKYCDCLRKAFPDACFEPSHDRIADFETIRTSDTLILPVSTFAWLAAWLSNASKIVLPVLGLYNHWQQPNIDLLPLVDYRYEFYQFPIYRSNITSLDSCVNFEDQMHLDWSRISPSALLRY
jgi:hypothetical protein